MARAILLVLDSVGIGGAPDAARYGDSGANTLGHIRDFRRTDGRYLALPNLAQLGLWQALGASDPDSDLPEPVSAPDATWGIAREISTGKDTTTGHWEIACAPPTRDFGYFYDKKHSLPNDLIQAIIETAGLPGILGNCHASGTEIIARLGSKHVATGKPIIYTSADSVIQIAAHEGTFGLDRLYALCHVIRKLADCYMIGRVIARPFTDCDGTYQRTTNRRDFALPPFSPTLLDDLTALGRQVIGVGKIHDIFAGNGVGENHKAHGIEGTLIATLNALENLTDGGLIFSNIVEFDSEFGHRRDTEGYAGALEEFDALLPKLTERLQPGDLLIITADHGNDPTWCGSDHTREQVPILVVHPGAASQNLGVVSFSDIGASIAAHLGIRPTGPGVSFLSSQHEDHIL
ncbi:MAG: phosphopentomutase [Sulfitobacter sp. SK025]|nr:MAG: phosphopentomutase [Sulfitobacter sp. SK025]